MKDEASSSIIVFIQFHIVCLNKILIFKNNLYSHFGFHWLRWTIVILPALVAFILIFLALFAIKIVTCISYNFLRIVTYEWCMTYMDKFKKITFKCFLYFCQYYLFDLYVYHWGYYADDPLRPRSIKRIKSIVLLLLLSSFFEICSLHRMF